MFQVEAPRERIVAHNWETTMISHNDSLISHSALAAKSCNDTCSENPPYKSVDTLECRVRPGLLTSDWDSAKESLVVHSTKFVFARICRLRMKRNAQVWLCWLFEPKEDLVVVRCRIHSDVEKHCDPLTSWVLPQECPSLMKCLGGVCSKEGVDFDSPPRNDSLSGSDNGISNSVFSARSETQPIGAAEEGLGRRTAVFIDTTFFQWYPGVKLSALLKNQNNNIPLSMYPHCAGVRPFTEDVSVHILRAIGDAIHGLHERGIPHGGIEPNAIFVTPSLRIFVKKQCDAPHQLPLPDSLRWRPPEFSLLLDDDVPLSVEEQMKGDVWSFGCLALLLVSGQRPYASEDDVRGIASRLSSLLEVGSSNPLGGVDETTAVRMLGIDLDVPVCSANLVKLIQRCLHPNPRLRPSMTELLTSSAFRRVSLSSASIPSVISCLTEGSNPLTAGPNTTRKGKETNSNSFTAEDVRVLCMNAWLVETVRMFKKNFLCEGQSQRDWPAGGEVGLSSMSSKDMRRRNCQSFVADLSSNLRSEIFGCSEQVISYVDRCFSANQDETLVSATMETIRNLVGFTRDAGSRSSHVHGKHLSSSSEDMSSRGKAWLNNFWQAFPFTSTKRLVKSDSKRHLSTILTSEISQVPDDDYTLTMTQSVAMNADVSEDDEHVCETCLQTDGRAHGLTRVRGTAFSRVEEEAGVTHFSKSVSDQIVGLSLKKILIVMSVVGFSVVVVVMCAIVIVKHA